MFFVAITRTRRTKNSRGRPNALTSHQATLCPCPCHSSLEGMQPDIYYVIPCLYQVHSSWFYPSSLLIAIVIEILYVHSSLWNNERKKVFLSTLCSQQLKIQVIHPSWSMSDCTCSLSVPNYYNVRGFSSPFHILY